MCILHGSCEADHQHMVASNGGQRAFPRKSPAAGLVVVVVTHLLLTCSRGFVVEEFQTDSAPGILVALKIQKYFGSRWHREHYDRVKLDLFASIGFLFRIMMFLALSGCSFTS